MKKLISFYAIIAFSLTASAQVAFWRTNVVSHWDNETQRYTEQKDIVSDVSCFLKYDQIKNIQVVTSQHSADEKALRLFLFIDDFNYRQDIDLHYYYSNVNEQYGTFEYESTLDSIVWKPYPVIGIDEFFCWHNDRLYKDTLILPLRDYQHYNIPNDEYYLGSRTEGVRPIPEYATVKNISIEVANKNICDIKDVTYHYTEFGLGAPKYGFRYNLYPYAEGTTDVTVTFDGVTKKFTVVIMPKETIPDAQQEADVLFDKIYSRMTETGDRHPTGYCDIPLVGIDEGSTSLTRLVYLNDLPTDQIYWVWRDADSWSLDHNNWTATNSLLHVLFHRLYFNIYLCNSYLHKKDVKDLVRIAEVRFIRAYLYAQLLDLFGNVPIVTDNADFYTAPQVSRAALYDFVVAELLAAEKDLAAEKEDYYRLDKSAAWLLLSRLYLNSEVYAGKNDFSLAAQYAYKVLQSNYSLCSEYRRLFMGDNDTNGAQNEIIWALRQVGSEQSSYGGSMTMVGTYADQVENMGISSPWYAANTRYQLLDLFSVRNTATSYTGTIVKAGDDRALFSKTSYYWNSNNTGRTVHKWTNERTDGQAGTDSYWPDTDIPLFRMAEAYLNYAEAVLRGGAIQGNLSALDAVNAIRTRAHANAFTEINLQTILDERGREFYAEGMRRPDLIRFNKFGGDTGYQWQYKGGANNGTDFPAYMNLYPIPQLILQMNPALIQNEGYSE